jgi:Domain of unknown function (DUF4169)
MMVAPANLNRYRKRKARDADSTRADENAARFGRPKAEKDLIRARADKARRDLDGHKGEA